MNRSRLKYELYKEYNRQYTDYSEDLNEIAITNKLKCRCNI